jgi:hypothetical protein
LFVADQVQEDDKRAVLLAVFRNDFAPIASECSLLADIVAKVENRAALKNLAKVDLWTSLLLCCFFNATTEIRDRFWMKRCGPSRRLAQNASTDLRVFVRHPKKTSATISARLRYPAMSVLWSLSGEKRK